MDKLEKFNYINQLLETYGSLLTESQHKIKDQYYCFNLSLSEIAENNDVSRTAVSDCLKKSISKLQEFEEKLNLISLKAKILEQIETIKKASTLVNIEKLERMIKDGI